jgi:lipopolysaccharide/colanic/teichoic acid biosynthesis glycosyltransferase
VDSGATRPHVQAPEQLVQQVETNHSAPSDSAIPFVADNDSLTSALPGPEAATTSEAPALLEIASAPPPAFAIASLARYQRLERVVNVIVAALGLIIAAPVMLIIAIVIKLTSTGPVLYQQPRVGLNRRGVRLHARRRSDSRWHLWAQFLAAHDNLRTDDLGGRVFMIYKFRTMCEAAESATGAVWAVQNDPRSTRIGCFLRKYRLDELPQLFNVLKGDMNIVGPRPERPSIFARLAAEIEEYPQRQRTKPGITGWAQIHLKYDSCIDDVRRKVRYDLEYLRQKSLGRDLKIMVKTLPSVLFKRRGW